MGKRPLPQRAPTPGPPDHAPPRQTTNLKGGIGWEGQKFCLDTSQLNLGILPDVYFHCWKQRHEEEVDPVELEMYQAQTDQSVQRPLLVERSKPERTIPSAAPRQWRRRARGLSSARRRGARAGRTRPAARAAWTSGGAAPPCSSCSCSTIGG